MRIDVLPLLLIGAALLTGCTTVKEAGASAPPSDPAERARKAIEACVERTRLFPPSTMQNARQIIGVKTDAEAAPILCERLLRGLAEGRIGPRDLEWDDGPNPQSTRLIRVLKGR